MENYLPKWGLQILIKTLLDRMYAEKLFIVKSSIIIFIFTKSQKEARI